MSTQLKTDDGCRDLQPADVFERAIWTNSDICNNCFARVRTVDETSIWVGKNDQKRMDWEYRDRTRHSQLDHDVDAKGETGLIATRDKDGRVIGSEPINTHSARYRETTRTTCLRCGSVGCRATDHTLSRREALRRVDPLVERLREQDIDIDHRRLRSAVRYYKSSDKWQGFDFETFAAAVRIAVRPT